MDLSSWLWVVLFVAFGSGWLLARYDIKSVIQKKNTLPVEYFKGLQYLLNEQPDKAVDAFIQVAKLDPETADLHLALGQMFRKRGEFTRSIRIHESLANRGLSIDYQEKAYMALGEDYYKAGMFDRAENIFTQFIQHKIYDQIALKYLLIMAKLQQNWPKAVDLAKLLPKEQASKQVFHLNMQYIEILLQSKPLKNDKLRDVFQSIPAQHQQHIRYQLAYIKWQELTQKYTINIKEIKQILLSQNTFNKDAGIHAAIYGSTMTDLIDKAYKHKPFEIFALLEEVSAYYQDKYIATHNTQEKEAIFAQKLQIFNIMFKLKLENLYQQFIQHAEKLEYAEIFKHIVQQIHTLCQNKLHNDDSNFSGIKTYAQFLLDLKNMQNNKEHTNDTNEDVLHAMYILLENILKRLQLDKTMNYICQECGFRSKNFTWACHGCGEYESLSTYS
jgi:lipopolysaccharide biosynthesis regulator YciM